MLVDMLVLVSDKFSCPKLIVNKCFALKININKSFALKININKCFAHKINVDKFFAHKININCINLSNLRMLVKIPICTDETYVKWFSSLGRL